MCTCALNKHNCKSIHARRDLIVSKSSTEFVVMSSTILQVNSSENKFAIYISNKHYAGEDHCRNWLPCRDRQKRSELLYHIVLPQTSSKSASGTLNFQTRRRPGAIYFNFDIRKSMPPSPETKRPMVRASEYSSVTTFPRRGWHEPHFSWWAAFFT